MSEFFSLLLAASEARFDVERQVIESLNDAFPNFNDEKPSDANPLSVLNKTYVCLCRSPELWSSSAIGQNDVNTVKLFYGILRESPDLWCSVGVGSRILGKRKRGSDI